MYADSSTASVYGGTFQGGDSGPATDTLYYAGSGLNANGNSTVDVFGGSFTGGNAALVPGGPEGAPGDGLVDLGGNLNVYGGSFTGGTNGFDPTNGFGIDVFSGNTTLYGSNFFVNGIAVSSGSLMPSMGTITGDFQDNAGPTTFTYDLLPLGGTLNISAPAVPEASTTVSFGLLLALGLGGLVVAARRKKIAP